MYKLIDNLVTTFVCSVQAEGGMGLLSGWGAYVLYPCRLAAEQSCDPCVTSSQNHNQQRTFSLQANYVQTYSLSKHSFVDAKIVIKVG